MVIYMSGRKLSKAKQLKRDEVRITLEYIEKLNTTFDNQEDLQVQARILNRIHDMLEGLYKKPLVKTNMGVKEKVDTWKNLYLKKRAIIEPRVKRENAMNTPPPGVDPELQQLLDAATVAPAPGAAAVAASPAASLEPSFLSTDTGFLSSDS